MSAWGQPSLITEEVGLITARMDQQDGTAYCELGRLMRRYGPARCSSTAESLSSKCDDTEP